MRIRGFVLCWACTDQSCTDQFFFFFENPWVFVFSILGFFFFVGLPVTVFFFSDFSSNNFFGLKVEQIIFYFLFFISEGVPNFDLGFPNFFLEGKQIKKF